MFRPYVRSNGNLMAISIREIALRAIFCIVSDDLETVQLVEIVWYSIAARREQRNSSKCRNCYNCEEFSHASFS
jgi:hypothetical protein